MQNKKKKFPFSKSRRTAVIGEYDKYYNLFDLKVSKPINDNIIFIK